MAGHQALSKAALMSSDRAITCSPAAFLDLTRSKAVKMACVVEVCCLKPNWRELWRLWVLRWQLRRSIISLSSNLPKTLIRPIGRKEERRE